jgi:hypothetical protein
MAKIVYTDRDKSAPYVSSHGIAFTHGQAVDVDDDLTDLLEMAEANPFFEVTEFTAPAEEATGPASRRGLKAASVRAPRK